jgi:hypothetical protein
LPAQYYVGEYSSPAAPPEFFYGLSRQGIQINRLLPVLGKETIKISPLDHDLPLSPAIEGKLANPDKTAQGSHTPSPTQVSACTS